MAREMESSTFERSGGIVAVVQRFNRCLDCFQCSASCGQGNKSLVIFCKERDSGRTVDSVYCPMNKRPSNDMMPCFASKACSWFTGKWSECSVSCGQVTEIFPEIFHHLFFFMYIILELKFPRSFLTLRLEFLLFVVYERILRARN